MRSVPAVNDGREREMKNKMKIIKWKKECGGKMKCHMSQGV